VKNQYFVRSIKKFLYNSNLYRYAAVGAAREWFKLGYQAVWGFVTAPTRLVAKLAAAAAELKLKLAASAAAGKAAGEAAAAAAEKKKKADSSADDG
jgi:hypothetical protein